MLEYELTRMRRLLNEVLRLVWRAVMRHRALQERVVRRARVHRLLIQEPMKSHRHKASHLLDAHIENRFKSICKFFMVLFTVLTNSRLVRHLQSLTRTNLYWGWVMGTSDLFFM
jgi:hypothetical protein